MPSFGKDLAMSGRGGPRHEPKPWVDVGLVYKCLEKHDGLVANLGSYEHLNSAAAPNAKALLHLKNLWVGLLELSPTGSIHSQPLRQALVSLLAKKPDMNQGRHSGGVWANLKIERFNCLLKHVRMLGRSKAALGPAVCQLAKSEYTSLLAGLEKLQLPQEKVKEPEKKRTLQRKGKLKKKQKRRKLRLEKSKRKLKPRDGEVSVDSKGVPQLFNSPFGKKGEASSSSGLKKPAAAGSQLASLQRPGTRLLASMGYGLEKPLHGKAKPKGVIKRPSTKKNFKPLERGTTPGKRQSWVHLSQTDASNPPRSYIQGTVQGGKKHMIVQATAHQSQNYKGIVGKLWEALEKDSLTKGEVVKVRDEFLEKEHFT